MRELKLDTLPVKLLLKSEVVLLEKLYCFEHTQNICDSKHQIQLS